jgi:hypothetical protein
VRACTLPHNPNGSAETLIDINMLEYAAVIIMFPASNHHLRPCLPHKGDPFLVAALCSENQFSEAWSQKGWTISTVVRSLSRRQCALMLDNPIGLTIGHISTKENVVADTLSRLPSFLAFQATFPQLLQTHV